MGLGNTCTSWAAAMICRLLSVMIDVGLLQSVLYMNTLDEWVKMAQSDCLRIIRKEQESFSLYRPISVPHQLDEIQTTSPRIHTAIPSA